MTPDPPRAARNPAVVEAARLHRSRHRRQTGLTLIEGPHLLVEAVGSGTRIQAVYALAGEAATADLARSLGFEPVTVTEAAMALLSGTDSRSGPVAVIEIPVSGIPDSGDLLVAHGVSDPGNLGTMIRTAAALGWGVAHTPGTVDPWSPKVLRAGSGGHFRTSITLVTDMSALDELTTVAAVVGGGIAPEEVAAPRLALLVGDEAAGLPADVAARCDLRVSIPMPGGMESLNAAVASGILMYLLTRRRRAGR